ncbi:MAG TPA: transporter [Dissulfurispiraceae bacterium]|nr:transporter [Dissulfurispiraceae bacterium]
MKRVLLCTIFMLLLSSLAFAAHPLITDDAGTQGKGKFQLEINAQYGRDDNEGAIQYTTPAATALTYGVIDPVDVSIGVPYQWIKTMDSETTERHDGFGDVVLAVKWRFYETDGFSFALKPGITFPTGDQDKELGTGKVTYSLFFITTKELKLWAFHLNLGYIGNENKLDQRVPLWHISLAAEVEVAKGLKLVANTGIQRNTDKNSNTDPAFLLGGVVYSITDNVDIDAGYKYGLTKPEVGNTVLAGMTFRF